MAEDGDVGESLPANAGCHVFFVSLICDRGFRDEVELVDPRIRCWQFI